MSVPPGGNAYPKEWMAAESGLTVMPGTSWTTPFLELLPVERTSVSTFGSILSSETLWASDEVAARIDEIQFDVGEGPSWDAQATSRPVLASPYWDHGPGLWSAFTDALGDVDIQAAFSFPLHIGPLGLGAVGLYGVSPVQMSRHDISAVQAVSDRMARLVLQRAIGLAADETEIDSRHPHSRRFIHQATGFVIGQTNLSAEDAYLVIQGRSFADGRTMQSVAEDIVTGQLVFTTRDEEIEDAS